MNSNQLLARNPGVVLLQWLNNTPQNDIDVFNFKELDETKNIDQSLNNEECVLQCLPCQRTFKCISSLQRHCKVSSHFEIEFWIYFCLRDIIKEDFPKFYKILKSYNWGNHFQIRIPEIVSDN